MERNAFSKHSSKPFLPFSKSKLPLNILVVATFLASFYKAVGKKAPLPISEGTIADATTILRRNDLSDPNSKHDVHRNKLENFVASGSDGFKFSSIAELLRQNWQGSGCSPWPVSG